MGAQTYTSLSSHLFFLPSTSDVVLETSLGLEAPRGQTVVLVLRSSLGLGLRLVLGVNKKGLRIFKTFPFSNS